MKYIISISGGKDSTACLLYMLERVNKEDIIPVFMDTKWEADVNYEYLKYLEEKLDIEIVRIESEGMVELAKRKKMIPNVALRTCTFELKIKPFTKFVYENFVSKGVEFINVVGIRREESCNRSKEEVFKIQTEYYRGEKNIKFTFPVLQPIAYWSEEEVKKYITDKGIELNSLYKKGHKRVGCYPCIFWNKQELRVFMQDKKALQRLRDLEKEISELKGKKVTFFNKDKDLILREKSLFEGVEV